MGTGIFWGIILIIIGLSLIIKIVFNIDFPIFKLLIAFFFIYLGIRILIGPSFKPLKSGDPYNVIFGERVITKVENMREYNVVFGKAIFDLRNYVPDSNVVDIKINTVFGTSEVLLNDSISSKIEANAVFAHADLPNGNSASFGYTSFFKDSTNQSNELIIIHADVVFGSFATR